MEYFIDCIQNGKERLTGLNHARKVAGILAS